MHTPGPLEGGKWKNTLLDASEDILGDFWEITTPTDNCQDFETVGYARTREDSKLFAAAPELLATLEAAMELGAYRGDRMPIKAVKPIFDAMKAAITKAKGGTT